MLPGALELLQGGLVAERVETEVGVVALDSAGSIPLLLVDPAYRRRGVGTRLLEAGMARLGELGVTTVGLGSGGDDYIWPGVPDDLPGCGAAGFFEARGGGSTTRCSTWGRPARLSGAGRGGGAGGTVRGVDRGHDRAERAEVLAFEAATFPDWVTWFERLDLGAGRP